MAAVLAGASVFVDAWQASRAWAGSDEAQRAAVSIEEPIWLDASSPAGTRELPSSQVTPTPSLLLPIVADGGPSGVTAPAPSQQAPPPSGSYRFATGDGAPVPSAVASGDVEVGAPVDQGGAPAGELAAPSVEASSTRPGPAEVELTEIDFRFLDPPEPGAHARLLVRVKNHASVATGPLAVSLPTRWLRDFEVFGAIPSVLDDRQTGEHDRWFVFGGVAPGEVQAFELHVVAVAEEIEGPEVRVILNDGAEFGRGHPRTVAPRPNPGPARALTIPKLGVRASVTPVHWEPPPYVIGQLQGTAAVSLGNTVLIGHLAGPLGDVFARLDRLRPGDEVVAISRGLEYRFVVSEITVRPHDDVEPTLPTTTPRLTLMTCTGGWSIVRQDYSHRLWVVAEPAELAQQTIRANAERAAMAAREAEAAAALRATHEAAVAASTPVPEAAEARQTPPPVVGSTPSSPPSPLADAPTSEPAAEASAASPASDGAARAPGVFIDSPGDGGSVARRATIRGRHTSVGDPDAGLWLFVRAAVEGSRWYAYGSPLEPDRRGNWQVELEIGGPPGVQHEIRVGVVDTADGASLRRHSAERSGQPLDDLPGSFRIGADVLVKRR
jgi:Sortase domain